MSEARVPVTIDQEASEEDAIDLDEWELANCGGDELENRLMKLGKQMYSDAMALPRNDAVRVTLMRDAANVFSKLIGMREGGKAGAATPAPRGGTAVGQITRDDAAASYLRMIEGPAE